MSAWPAIVFGWPAVLLALVLSVLGIARLKPAYVAGGAALAIPFSFYLTGTPRFWWMGLGIPLLLIGAAIAVKYRRAEIAWTLLVPAVAAVGWLAVIVIGE